VNARAQARLSEHSNQLILVGYFGSVEDCGIVN